MKIGNAFDRSPLRRSAVAPLMAVGINLLLLFAVYSVCRLEFWLLNRSYFSEAGSGGYLPRLFAGGVVFDSPGIFYTNVLWILMVLFPLHLKENAIYQKICKWVFVTVNAAAVVANIADSVYFRFTLRRTSADVFGEFANETNIARIFATEALSHWYLVLLGALLIWGIWKLYFMPALDMKRQPLPRYYLLTVLSLVFAGLICVGGIRGGFLNRWYNYVGAFVVLYAAWRLWQTRSRSRSRKPLAIAFALCGAALVATAPIGGWRHRDIRPVAIANAASWTNHPVETALVLNTPFSMIRSAGKTKFADPHYFASLQEAETVFTPLHEPAPGAALKRKNVVVLIMESFGREYIGSLARHSLGDDYKGYTPFLDSLANHSTVFVHSYANGTKSIDGIPSVLTSIPMFVQPFVLTPYALNKIDGLASHLGREGWHSAFFHGARTGSMGFDAISRSIGFKEYYGREDFNKDPRFGGDADFDGYWAIWDEPFLLYYSSKMSEMPQPFVTALFSASSHHPFRIPEKYEGKFPEGTLPIHKTIGYSDNALRRFFDFAKTQPWYDNTIFVISNDHNNMSGHPEFTSDIGRYYATLFFFDPSGEFGRGMRGGVAQQIDVMPTLLGYLGYDKPYIAFGSDLTSTPEEQTWAVNYTNGTYQYVKGGFVLQFDGSKVTGLYDIEDHAMERNLAGHPQYQNTQQAMELELKAVIQSYMDRMLHDRLTAG